jgi:HK97 family phage major capsid protein
MFKTLPEMEAELTSIRGGLKRIMELPDPTEADLNEQATLIAAYDELEPDVIEQRTRQANLRRIMEAADQPENREEPEPNKAPEMFVRSNVDPFAELERVEKGMVLQDELRARAQTLIERDEKDHLLSHDFAETAYERSVAMGADRGVARHMLLTGSREYRDAFRAYLENPMTGQARLDELPMSMRAMNLTNASGGYLLPYILDPQIVLTNTSSANFYRRAARIVQTTSNAWQGVNSAGVTAAMIAEAVTASDMSPTLGQIQVTPQKAVAWVLGSYEALDDTNFGEQLPGLLADAKDRLESAKFTTGAGTASNEPLGIASALAAGSRVAPVATGAAFSTTTGTAYTGPAGMADVMNLQAALPPRFRNSSAAAFAANIVVINKIRSVDQYGGAQFWANLTSPAPASLLGQAIYEGSDMNAVTTGTSAASGTASMTLLYGDWNQFIICDRVGVSMLYDPMLKGTGNAQLPTGQAGWYMFWRYGSNVSTTAAFRYLTIS